MNILRLVQMGPRWYVFAGGHVLDSDNSRNILLGRWPEVKEVEMIADDEFGCPSLPPQNDHRCEMCGSADAALDVDPFLAEVMDDKTPRWLCDLCREIRREDI